MRNIADLLFQVGMLKKIPRSGYQFLGSGEETVAEHVFVTTFIAFVITQMQPEIDAPRLINMCLVHDLLEARTGDLNYVQKKYVASDDQKALSDTIENLPFGGMLADLWMEFTEGKTKEAILARDADQIAFLIDLKAMSDRGNQSAKKWLPHVQDRLRSITGKAIAKTLLEADHDHWWLQNLLKG